MKNKNILKKMYHLVTICLICFLLYENIPVFSLSRPENTINNSVATYSDESLHEKEYKN